MPSQLFQRLQLDVADAKAKYMGKIKHEVEKLEQKLVETRHNHKSLHRQDDDSGSARSGGSTDAGARAADLKLTDDSEGAGVAGASIGTLKLSVKWLQCRTADKVFVVVNVEDEEIKSAVAFKDKSDAAKEDFTFHITAKFAISDICALVSVRVYASVLLKAKDTLLGRVVLPVRSLMPHQNGPERSGFGLGKSGTYRLYPVGRLDSGRPVPGQVCVLKTGLEYAAYTESLELGLTHVLELKSYFYERAAWPLYFSTGTKEERRRQRRAEQDAHRRNRRSHWMKSLSNAPQALLDSVTEIKRNRSRIASVAEQVGSSPPVRYLWFLYSWESPLMSTILCAAMLAAAKWVSAYLLPWLVLICVAGLIWLNKQVQLERHASWALWDFDVTMDPDIGLTTFQRFISVIDKMDDAGKGLDKVAEALEKVVNAFSSADEMATIGVLLACFVAAVAWSAVLLAAERAGMNPLGIVGVAVVGMGANKRFGPRMSGPGALLRNLYRTVPSHDDLGSAWITKTQQITSVEAERRPRSGDDDDVR